MLHILDMCGIELNKVTNCESTSYCTESGFCNKEPSCFTKEMESNPLCELHRYNLMID